ncbi:MAG: HlyD family efflux transporter periplasmic adaptor subunit [Methylobacterium frigidaeris]
MRSAAKRHWPTETEITTPPEEAPHASIPDPAPEPAPSAESASSPERPALDVHGLHRTLEENLPLFAPPVPDPAPPADPAPAAKSAARGAWWREPVVRRAGKTLLGAVVVAVFGVVPLRALLQTSSVEAVVNARVVTLRAPIAGEVVAAQPDLSPTAIVPRGTALLSVVDARADRASLAALQRQLGQVRGQRTTVAAKLRHAEMLAAALAEQAEQFRHGRIEQLEARSAELESLIAVAAVRREEAAAARERAAALARSGSVSAAELARLAREASAAAGTEVATRHRLTAASVELKNARAGIFIGDSYNDRPSSIQRGDEARQRVADLRAEDDALAAETDRLRAEIDAETTHHRARAEATMTLPVAGRVWEVLVSPGEQVRVGQDLVRFIDCSATYVTANVTEAVYNRLSVGSPARFIPADGGPDLVGSVANLTGLAGAPANLAITPAALSKEPYRVTVALRDSGAQPRCGVGRTGRVVFGGDEAGTR